MSTDAYTIYSVELAREKIWFLHREGEAGLGVTRCERDGTGMHFAPYREEGQTSRIPQYDERRRDGNHPH
jgi:hypothetical protein